MSGNNNPFFGKTHNNEQREKWKGWDRLNATGKTDIEIYGEETALKRRKNISDALKKSKKCGKKWRIVTPDGEEIIQFGLKSFCKDRGLYDTALIRVAQKRLKGIEASYKGWICEYIFENGEHNE